MTRKETFFKILQEDFDEEDEGFICKFSQNTFIKDIGKDRITLKYATTHNFGLLEPYYYIYIHEVEQLRKKAKGKAYFKNNSLQTRKGHIVYYYNLQSEIEGTFLMNCWEDLEDAACRELCFYHDFMKSNYFEKYLDIQVLNHDLNLIEYDDKYNFTHFNHARLFLAELAMCVSSICGNNNMLDIKMRYIDNIQMTKEKEQFSDFCKYFGV